MKRTQLAATWLLTGGVALSAWAGHYVTLDMLGVTEASTARGKVVLNGTCFGGNIKMNGKVYWRGYGVAAPRINGPAVIGVRPGRPVLHRLGVTGEQPLSISVEAPAGLTYDAASRVLSGSIAKPGAYDVRVKASNAKGTAERVLTVRVGDAIGLTPAMGWNSWNCFTEKVTQEKVERAAEAMVESGLADHGWQYIVTDDYWAYSDKFGKEDETLRGPARAPDGTINANRRFPSMKALADRIHARGLKAGLYSSPGQITCGFCTGSWDHEEQDARTFAEWGYDFLKYDWCYYGRVAMGKDLDREMYPYLVMGRALRTRVLGSVGASARRHPRQRLDADARERSWRRVVRLRVPLIRAGVTGG